MDLSCYDRPPAAWDDFVWPDWVPTAVRDAVEDFWSAEHGRGPAAWANAALERGAPPTGHRMTTTGLAGRAPVEGRFVFSWNNMCRIVTDDATVVVDSFAPHHLPDDTDAVDADTWRAEAAEKFGDDPAGWRFTCPACGNVASVADHQAAGSDAHGAATTCLGRHTDTAGCDWAAFGLLGTAGKGRHVRADHGPIIEVFAFADHP
jgi:hypothetical protein